MELVELEQNFEVVEVFLQSSGQSLRFVVSALEQEQKMVMAEP